MRILHPTLTLLTGLMLSNPGCRCGEAQISPNTSAKAPAAASDDSRTNADGWDRKVLDALLAGLPKSKMDSLIDAVPHELPWRAQSRDPAVWLRYMRSREGYQAFAGTPLAEELRSQGPWLTLESMRKQVLGLTSFVGASQDDDGLWRGEVALGSRSIEDERPAFVVVKRVLPEIQVVARFVAAFASVGLDAPQQADARLSANEREQPKLKTEKIGSATLHTLHRAGTHLHFALFRDVLIFGSDEALVRNATRIAAGEIKPKNDTRAALWPDSDEPGIHIAWSTPRGGPLDLFAIDALGLTLGVDEKQPFALRLLGGRTPSPDATQLLRYAPGTTFGAWVDGRKPAEDFLQEVRRRVLPKTGPRTASPSRLDELETTIGSKLQGGIAFWLGNDANLKNNPSPRGVVAFRHADKKALEPAVRAFLAELTARKVERNVLEPVGGAFLLTTGDDSPAAALSDDALLVALSPTPLRDALHAGAGKTRSILDAAKTRPSSQASHALYVNMEQAAVFLRNFYRAAFEGGVAPGWEEAGPLLEPTFAAVSKFGTYFGELSSVGDSAFAGGLHALP